MQAFPKKYDDASAVAGRLTAWLQEQQKKRVENVVAGMHAKGHGWNIGLWFVTGIGGFLTLISLAASTDAGPSHTFQWLPFGTYPGIGGGVALILASALESIRSKPTQIMREAKRAQVEPQFNADPLVQRARLVVEAAQAYAAHCARYRRWREEVEEEIVPPNEEKADEYHIFLTAARGVICSASANFWNVVGRKERAEAFAAAHPEHARSPDDQSLALLLEELRVDVAPPEVPGTITDPVQALESEEQIARIARELRVLERAG